MDSWVDVTYGHCVWAFTSPGADYRWIPGWMRWSPSEMFRLQFAYCRV